MTDAPRLYLDLLKRALVNTLYFNAAWKHPFEKEKTGPGNFTLGDGSTARVELMAGENLELSYGKLDGVEAPAHPSAQFGTQVHAHLEAWFESRTLPPDTDTGKVAQRLTVDANAPDYKRYRDTHSGVSPMAIPGTPGVAYTADGLEHGERGVDRARHDLDVEAALPQSA